MSVNDVSKIKIPILLGKTLKDQVVSVDLSKTYHLLIAGISGCGKSTLIHNLIRHLISYASINEIRLILVDPKIVDMNIYNGLPNLLIPVVTKPQKICSAINWLLAESDSRLNLFASAGVRNIDEYNLKTQDKIQHIVLIYDGYLHDQIDINSSLLNLLSEGRQTGIHIILSSYDLLKIKGLINYFPSYACFQTNGKMRIQGIDDGNLFRLPIGEFYYLDQYLQKDIRLISPDISFQSHIEAVQKYISNDIVKEDDRSVNSECVIKNRDMYFEEAGRFIIEKDKASIGMLQRIFKIGFNRAAGIMEQLEEISLVGPEVGTKPREVLMSLEDFMKYIDEEK